MNDHSSVKTPVLIRTGSTPNYWPEQYSYTSLLGFNAYKIATAVCFQ
jgi:hypothetical protein